MAVRNLPSLDLKCTDKIQCWSCYLGKKKCQLALDGSGKCENCVEKNSDCRYSLPLDQRRHSSSRNKGRQPSYTGPQYDCRNLSNSPAHLELSEPKHPAPQTPQTYNIPEWLSSLPESSFHRETALKSFNHPRVRKLDNACGPCKRLSRDCFISPRKGRCVSCTDKDLRVANCGVK